MGKRDSKGKGKKGSGAKPQKKDGKKKDGKKKAADVQGSQDGSEQALERIPSVRARASASKGGVNVFFTNANWEKLCSLLTSTTLEGITDKVNVVGLQDVMAF